MTSAPPNTILPPDIAAALADVISADEADDAMAARDFERHCQEHADAIRAATGG